MSKKPCGEHHELNSNMYISKLSCLMKKTTKWHVHQVKTGQPGHPPSLVRVFAVRMKKAWILSYPLSAKWRLIRLVGCPDRSESSLGAHAIFLVLSWGQFTFLRCSYTYNIKYQNWAAARQNQQKDVRSANSDQPSHPCSLLCVLKG